MTIQDRHDLNFIRKQITGIEIELMPDMGQEVDPDKVEHFATTITQTLSGLLDRLQGIN